MYYVYSLCFSLLSCLCYFGYLNLLPNHFLDRENPEFEFLGGNKSPKFHSILLYIFLPLGRVLDI